MQTQLSTGLGVGVLTNDPIAGPAHLAVPSAIFDFDIGPGAEHIQSEPRGELARPS